MRALRDEKNQGYSSSRRLSWVYLPISGRLLPGLFLAREHELTSECEQRVVRRFGYYGV